jgi:hypothetical protein
MADQFLPQDFTLPDYDGADLQHGLQLYTAGGEGFLKIWIGGEDAGMDMVCCLTKVQAEALAKGFEGLARRIGH